MVEKKQKNKNNPLKILLHFIPERLGLGVPLSKVYQHETNAETCLTLVCPLMTPE